VQPLIIGEKTYAERLAEGLGLMTYHFMPWHAKPSSLDVPDGCDAILVVDGTVRFAVRQQAQARALNDGIEFVELPADVRLGVSVLQAVGLAVASRAKGNPSVSEKVEVARRYVEVQMRKGNNPSKGEINGASQRVFGPQVSLTDKEILAARDAATKVEPAPSESQSGVNTALTALEAQVEDLQSQLRALQIELADAQQAALKAIEASKSAVGPTIFDLIERGCVITIKSSIG